jgi:hypothetical protein
MASCNMKQPTAQMTRHIAATMQHSVASNVDIALRKCYLEASKHFIIRHDIML